MLSPKRGVNHIIHEIWNFIHPRMKCNDRKGGINNSLFHAINCYLHVSVQQPYIIILNQESMSIDKPINNDTSHQPTELKEL